MISIGRRGAPGIVAAVSAMALVLAACGTGEGNAERGDKIAVVASTDAWGSVVSAVGGDRVSVKSIIDNPTGDPHSYESTAEDGLAFAEAKLAVYNGGGYDEFAAQLAKQTPDVAAINAFELAGKAAEAEEEEHGDEDEAGHEHGEVNEHVWYDLATVAKVADDVAAKLGEIEPDKAQEFTDNAKAFKSELDGLTEKLKNVRAGQASVKVVATEPVAHYLLEAAGLTDATPPAFSNAIEGETDVPVGAQDEVNKLIEGKRILAVINNPQTETPVTQQLLATAERAGVPVVDVTETLPEGEQGYLEWVGSQVEVLGAAFKQ